MKIFSQRVNELKPSPTLSLNARAEALKKQGKQIINLTAGEPDYPTPAPIVRAAKKALDQRLTKYTPAAGIEPLRQAIADKLKKQNRIPARTNEVVVGVGAKQLLAATMQILAQAGDEVIIPIPAWGTFITQAALTGAKPVQVKLEEPFKLTAEAVARKINKKTKLLIVNSPANPTGAVVGKAELERLGALAVRHKFFIIADETYEAFVYDKNRHISLASLSAKIRQRTVTINTFSKTYAMTGWRVGYAHARKEIAEKLAALSSQTTSGTNSIAQYAAIRAISGSQKPVEKMRRQFAARRALVTKLLNKNQSLQPIMPDGAFYYFLNITQALLKNETAQDWCQRLLDQRGVALVPGEAFAAPGYVRLSFAVSSRELKRGIELINRFVRA